MTTPVDSTHENQLKRDQTGEPSDWCSAVNQPLRLPTITVSPAGTAPEVTAPNVLRRHSPGGHAGDPAGRQRYRCVSTYASRTVRVRESSSNAR